MADRDFKGIWIPKEIWTDKKLNFLEKCILMEIDSLDNDGCFASNKYLAEFCQCSERKITDAINKLSETGLIKVQYQSNSKRIITSLIDPRKKCEGGSKICEGGSKVCEGGSKICDQEIITKKDSREEYLSIYPPISPQKRFTKPSLEEVEAYCSERCNGINAQEFIDYYESVGWKVGKKPMKDWKATVRYWERNRKQKPKADFDQWADEISKEFGI